MKKLKQKILYRLQHWFGAPDPKLILLESTYDSLEQTKDLLVLMSDERGEDIQLFAEDDLTVNVHTLSMDDLIEFLTTEFLRGDGERIEAGYWRRKNE